MSVILICRKFLSINLKPKLLAFNGFKLHTASRPTLQNLKSKTPNYLPKRFFFYRKPKRANLKTIDDIPEHYNLIYRSTLESYIFYAQCGIAVTAVLTVLTVLLMYDSPKSELKFGKTDEMGATSQANYAHVYCAIFTVIVVGMQLFLLRLPLRIYYLSQQKKYIFVFPTNIPTQTKKLVCNIGDVQKLSVTGILPWRDARFRIQTETYQKSVMMIEEHFRAPADLYIMLGVQRDPESED